jgi:uridine kinase
VDAAQPTAGAAHSIEQFFAGSADAAASGLNLFGVLNPADVLITRERGKALPESKNLWICHQRFVEVCRHFVDCATRNFFGSHRIILHAFWGVEAGLALGCLSRMIVPSVCYDVGMFQEILATKKPRVGNITFVAIDGRGGSGKSTAADMLAEKLGAEIVHTDDFAGWDQPLNWWPSLIKRIFEPIAQGATSLSYPRSKWWPNHHPEPVVDQEVTPVMILEGVSALRKEFRPYISVGVFMDTPREVCLRRGIERDLASDVGKTKAEIVEMWEEWAKDEDEYLEHDNPRAFADVVIDGGRAVEDQIR